MEAQPLPLHSPYLATPPEIKALIYSYLSSREVRTARLVNRGFATDLAGSVFKDGFVIRPDRDDRWRLENVCRRPWLAVGVKAVEIFAGDLQLQLLQSGIDDEVEVRRLLAEADSDSDDDSLMGQVLAVDDNSDEDDAFLSQGASMGGYYSDEEEYSSNYAEMRELFMRDLEVEQSIGYKGLGNFLQRLPNLKEVKVTSIKFPFSRKGVWLEELWPLVLSEFRDQPGMENTMSHQNSRVATERYKDVLSATGSGMIEKLVLDLMPMSTFSHFANFIPNSVHSYEEAEVAAKKSREEERMAKAVRNVRDLRLCFMSSSTTDLNHSSASKWLGSMQQLQILDLTWDMVHMNSESHPRPHSFLKIRWPRLQSLRLKRTWFETQDLLHFLQAHASTLRNLHLSENALNMLKISSFRKFLDSLKSGLKLEKFELLIHSSGRADFQWCSENTSQIYDEDWEEYTNVHHLSAKKLERYVLGGDLWPMVGEGPGEDGKWKHIITPGKLLGVVAGELLL